MNEGLLELGLYISKALRLLMLMTLSSAREVKDDVIAAGQVTLSGKQCGICAHHLGRLLAVLAGPRSLS